MSRAGIPEGITLDDIRQAISDLLGGVEHSFGRATKYRLIEDGVWLAPKAVVGLAARRIVGRPLKPSEFSSGVGPGQAVHFLRSHGFTVEEADDIAWDLEPGDSIVRKQLHARYGGAGQGGISPSAKSPNVMIFSQPLIAEQYGDKDGWKTEGCFDYTGEGQVGDMEIVRGNRRIYEHQHDGNALRLFEGASGEVSYVGEFRIDPDKPYYRTDALDREGATREAIIFRLWPVDVIPERSSDDERKTVVEEVEVEDSRTEIVSVPQQAGAREAVRREAELVHAYKTTIERKGRRLVRHRCRPSSESSALYTDLYDPDLNLLIEAKGSATRESVRMAIGQLADYSRFLEPRPRLAVLLPVRPRLDLEELLSSQRIAALWRREDGSFEGNADDNFV